MLARLQFKTCHSLNQILFVLSTQGWEEQKSAERRFFVDQINITMITGVNFSGLFPVKHKSPIGNPDGYYIHPPVKPIVPVRQK